VLTTAGKCLATGGAKHLPALKKGFQRSTATKYATVIAFKEMGSLAKVDKEVLSLLDELKAALIKNKTLQKVERDARLQLVDKAIEAVRG
jgi:hypothetical protein